MPVRGLGLSRGPPGPAGSGEEQTASPPLSQIRAARSARPPRAPSGLRGRERGSGEATAGLDRPALWRSRRQKPGLKQLRPPPARPHARRGSFGPTSPNPSHTPARIPSPAARSRYPQAPRAAAAGARPRSPRPAPRAPPPPPAGLRLLSPLRLHFFRFLLWVPFRVSPFGTSFLPRFLLPLFEFSEGKRPGAR